MTPAYLLWGGSSICNRCLVGSLGLCPGVPFVFSIHFAYKALVLQPLQLPLHAPSSAHTPMPPVWGGGGGASFCSLHSPTSFLAQDLLRSSLLLEQGPAPSAPTYPVGLS